MAPFKFGKKSSKEKKQVQSQTHAVQGSPPSSGKGFNVIPGNVFSSSNSFNSPEESRRFGQQAVAGAATAATNATVPSQQAETHQSRVYPTPTAAQQRNMSGAATTLRPHQTDYTPWNRIKLQNSPFPRYRHVTSAEVSADGKAYVIGGLHDQSVYGDTWIISSHDNATRFSAKTVEITESTPPPRVGHAGTLCGNAFVIFGGDTHKVNAEGLMDDDIYLFNINSYKWTIPHPVGPRPLGRYGHKISVIATTPMKTKLFLFGGQFDDTYFNDLAVFDLSSFRRADSHWEFIKPQGFVPPPLTNHTMVSYDYKLWVFGGDTLQGLINQVMVFDSQSNEWSVVETTGTKPPPMQEHAAVVYRDLMCVVGGKDEHDMYLNSVYFLNLKSHKWFRLPLFSAGIMQGRSGHSVSLLKNDKLLIMGGDKSDYARIEDYDLHTSETDMGRGTILYTLDLSHLDKICPGIYNTTSEVSLLGDEGRAFSPTTPPIKRTTGAPNKLDQQKQQATQQLNILTPYAGEAVDTPQTKNSNMGRFETPISKSLTDNENSTLTSNVNNSITSSANISGPGSIVNTPLMQDSVTRNVSDTPKPTSPIPELSSASISHELTAPKVLSLTTDKSQNQEASEDEIGTATLASSPTKGAVKYGSSILPEELQNTSGKSDMTANITIDSLSQPVEITKKANRIESNSSNIDANASESGVSKTMFDKLRSELQNLRTMTEEKAMAASEHIRELENERDLLKAEKQSHVDKGDLLKLEAKYDILDGQKSALEERVKELESLMDVKFLDLEALNGVMKQQNEKCEAMLSEEQLSKNLEEMEQKCALLTVENEQLKAKIEKLDGSGFRQNLDIYSEHLKALVDEWKTRREVVGSDDDKEEALNVYSKDVHHQTVITKLSSRLDDLLDRSQQLATSREKLNTEYKNLEMKHSSLSQDLLVKQSELQVAQENYKKSLSSMNNTAKALEVSQKELEKYKKLNGELQAELENLKLSNNEHTSASGDLASAHSDSSNRQEEQFAMKLNDLKAELYIAKQERDNLKDEVLQMKKKLLALGNE